jgi:hypothetical protein
MAQRFLSIANFEKYQRDSKRTYPWVPLYKKLLINPDFLKLDVNSRYIYVCLILIGSDCGNKIPNDVSYLAHRCSMDVSLFNLKPLYRYGFLQASKTTKWRLDREEIRGEERRGDNVLCAVAPTPKVRASIFPDGFEPDERAQSLATSYGLNPHKELAAFRDHHTAKGSVFKDWQAAFRNWLRNSLKFNQRNGHAMSRV